MINDSEKSKIAIALLIIILGAIGRFFLVEYVRIPNFEMITALALTAGMYLGGIYAMVIPVSIVFLSDIVIGNSSIIIFTWTAFAIIGLFGTSFRNNSHNIKLGQSMLIATLSTIFFYIYTNFGWWLMSGMYAHSLSGLIDCYVMALRFFKNQLIGNMIFVPIAIFSAKHASKLMKEKSFLALKQLLKFKNN